MLSMILLIGQDTSLRTSSLLPRDERLQVTRPRSGWRYCGSQGGNNDWYPGGKDARGLLVLLYESGQRNIHVASLALPRKCRNGHHHFSLRRDVTKQTHLKLTAVPCTVEAGNPVGSNADNKS